MWDEQQQRQHSGNLIPAFTAKAVGIKQGFLVLGCTAVQLIWRRVSSGVMGNGDTGNFL